MGSAPPPMKGAKDQYVPLSHCSGGAISPALTAETLGPFQDSIAVKELSQNFQDAIMISRKKVYSSQTMRRQQEVSVNATIQISTSQHSPVATVWRKDQNEEDFRSLVYAVSKEYPYDHSMSFTLKLTYSSSDLPAFSGIHNICIQFLERTIWPVTELRTFGVASCGFPRETSAITKETTAAPLHEIVIHPRNPDNTYEKILTYHNTGSIRHATFDEPAAAEDTVKIAHSDFFRVNDGDRDYVASIVIGSGDKSN
ncbi:uncharacterized protein CLUP02_14316 [Colletotrichum lupini]|uniref:Uncharacterized protein n=1 Tax=Colletotrichum lupini TaxID=145971 RepID=A0A9Q8WML8_9PEZI|nr:uncharacterized protein CLUP02_14316 [Colletotrichum lupini]UQC88791.1 hypothetical protein CLUP02_14316 [Colletotrichum lupini]